MSDLELEAYQAECSRLRAALKEAEAKLDEKSRAIANLTEHATAMRREMAEARVACQEAEQLADAARRTVASLRAELSMRKDALDCTRIEQDRAIFSYFCLPPGCGPVTALMVCGLPLDWKLGISIVDASIGLCQVDVLPPSNTA